MPRACRKASRPGTESGCSRADLPASHPPAWPGPQSMTDPRHWLAGRVAIVTGASRGIGAATAGALAGAGAHVVLAARDRDALTSVARGIQAAGGAATPVPTDVSKVEDVERLVGAAAQTGHLAALVDRQS